MSDVAALVGGSHQLLDGRIGEIEQWQRRVGRFRRLLLRHLRRPRRRLEKPGSNPLWDGVRHFHSYSPSRSIPILGSPIISTEGDAKVIWTATIRDSLSAPDCSKNEDAQPSA